MRVLVTGGSGSFGRAFIRRLLTQPDQWTAVASYSRDEVKASQLHDEFAAAGPFRAFLGDVRDRDRLSKAMRGVDVVVHAAALKRVDVGAYSPSEMIATNVLGTMNVVDAAIDAGVSRVVVISSDKACMPTNVYGSTKMTAEVYAVQANAYGYPAGTRISCVRYGNILGSRGSVYHIWRQQVRERQPMRLTDRRMTRFMMTIESAAELVLFALQHMQGGEVFVPVLRSANMGRLAEAVAIAEGVPDFVVVETGLRPGGEKIDERLLSDEEVYRARRVVTHLSVAPSHHEWVQPDFAWAGHRLDPALALSVSSSAASDLSVTELVEMIGRTEACR